MSNEKHGGLLGTMMKSVYTVFKHFTGRVGRSQNMLYTIENKAFFCSLKVHTLTKFVAVHSRA